MFKHLQIVLNTIINLFYNTVYLRCSKLCSYVFVEYRWFYTIAPFPFVNLAELCEKYRFNITPFAAEGAELKKSRKYQHSFSQVCFVLLLYRIVQMSYRIESTRVLTIQSIIYCISNYTRTELYNLRDNQKKARARRARGADVEDEDDDMTRDASDQLLTR